MPSRIIEEAIRIVAQEINNFLLRSAEGDGLVIPTNLLTQSGNLSQSLLEGGIALSVVNIEEDRLSKPKDIYRKQANGTIEVIQPEIRLNLYLLFTAVPSTTETDASIGFLGSLGNLSQVIGFFQTKAFFSRQNTPSMPAIMDRLVFELYPMTFEQQNHLWGAIGAKYMPSIMYKVRIVKVQEDQMVSSGQPIRQYKINGQDKNL